MRGREREKDQRHTTLNRTRLAWEINRKHMPRTDGPTDRRTEALGMIICFALA